LDESDDAVVQVHSDWSKDGNFLLRDFAMQVQGKAARTVTDRIGWDPVSRQSNSGVVDAAGGYGEGLWTQEATRWIIKSTGVMPDGRVAAATHTIARMNDYTYRWASLERTVGGRVVPGTDSYVMVRTPPSPRSAVKAR
ncbi:MAG: YybH family protein, partial [Isosphaeraceae bacterium]